MNRSLAAAMICAASAWAQTYGNYPPQNQDPSQFNAPQDSAAPDPPSRVARLNQIQGPVSFQPATVNEWTEATLNYPITIGDHLYADDGARAEMHIASTAIRLNSRSTMSFLNLDDRTVQIRLDQGAVIIRVKELPSDESYEIDTAQGAVTLLQPGEYRIDTDPDRNAMMVTVRSGDAAVLTNGESFPVHPRETAYFPGEGQPALQSANPNDSFDLYAMDLDRREDRIPPPRYVSRDMPGWQDLESNGVWTEVPEYGPVWRPRTVAADWSPYRYGHWAWVEPWGWTWIDDAPWGFAPFHYGRWAYIGGGWGWVPGPVVARPVYAPALVAFVGGRNWSVSVSAGGGAVGWFPLAPREVYVPSYHVSRVYVNRVNVVNVTNVTVINQTYVNQRVPGAVIAMRHDAFVSAQPVRRAMVEVPRDVAVRAQVAGTAPQVAPQRVSIIGPRSGGAVARPRAELMQRPVYAQHTPPPAAVPFAARQQALQANPGRPVDPRTVNQLRATTPVQQPIVRPVRPAAGNPYPQGSRPVGSPAGRFGNPQGNPAPAPAVPAPPAEAPRRFGGGGNRTPENPQNVPPGSTNPRPVNPAPQPYPQAPANNNPAPRPVNPTNERRPQDMQPRPERPAQTAPPQPYPQTPANNNPAPRPVNPTNERRPQDMQPRPERPAQTVPPQPTTPQQPAPQRPDRSIRPQTQQPATPRGERPVRTETQQPRREDRPAAKPADQAEPRKDDKKEK